MTIVTCHKQDFSQDFKTRRFGVRGHARGLVLKYEIDR